MKGDPRYAKRGIFREIAELKSDGNVGRAKMRAA